MSNRVLYLTNCYALPGQISPGPATRHFYHVKSLVQNGMTVKVITSDQSTVNNQRLTFDCSTENPTIQTVSIPAIRRDGIFSRMAYHVRFFAKTLLNAWKTPETDIVIGREITKMYEEFITGKIEEVFTDIDNIKEKGEFTVAIYNCRNK